MSTISSPGLASGIDIKSIVSQLVALERAPLQPLQRQAATAQSKISILSTIKSGMDNLGTLAAKLGDPKSWSGVNATSSNAGEVAVSASSTATAGRFTLSVTSLATSQAAASGVLNAVGGLGTGTLSFSVAGGASRDVEILAGEDSPAAIAAKINSSDVGVTATVLKDASGERIVMRSKETGASNTFTVGVAGGNADGLQKLAFGGGAPGDMTQTQPAANAMFSIDGVDLQSPTNKLTDTVPGVTLTLNKVTSAAVDINVATDTEGMKKNIQAFVDAYNSISTLLTTATAYNETTKTAGSLQGDSTAIGLQNALRGMMRSVTGNGAFTRLADIGIVAAQNGKLEVKADKLDAAMGNLSAVRNLFTSDDGDATTVGFGLKVKTFADGIAGATGSLNARTDSLKAAVTRNGKEQERVIDRAARAEVRYLAQYNAMDAAVGRLNGLSAFVNQQITLWNRNTG
ncbi:MAG: flagellar filament capping protein FliD [Hydrogenophaga sp.]|uniref:flagellar filament capping protein FliD n=2 Tax=Hydrogenophaga sp. TaxID=1904254 RepID=UPI002AB899EB|nr:flagellar filament capping protein FliD [Hydrogenophaga sp.]MDZ4282438.1 flagellar filament capping protein FliD [Hydrogenophaga sp.]